MPPVFGPVITSVLNDLPIWMFVGTTRTGVDSPRRRDLPVSMGALFGGGVAFLRWNSSSGCRASTSLTTPSVFNTGSTAFNVRLKRAFAFRKSSSASSSKAYSSSSRFSRTTSASSKRMRRISRCSASAASWSALFISTMARGSIKKVAPLVDCPWTTPRKNVRASCLIGRT